MPSKKFSCYYQAYSNQNIPSRPHINNFVIVADKMYKRINSLSVFIYVSDSKPAGMGAFRDWV
jgi:hypothetical protein